MTVKELKNILNGIDDNVEIVVNCIDPTDFIYTNDIEFVREEYLLEIDGERFTFEDIKDIEDEDRINVKKVLVIDGGEC
jgi:hypothetical protein